MEIYLVRHGETEWNKRGLLCGRTDIPLNEKGIRQAQALIEEVKKAEIELILTSPLQRAVHTAEIISQSEIQVIREPLLMEQDFGLLEGHIMLDEECLKYRNNFFYPFPEGESVAMVAHRALNLLERIKADYREKKILLVSHGAFCRAFHSCLERIQNEKYYHILFENCRMNRYEL